MTGGHNLDRRLPLYITGGHPCAYLPGLTARTLFLDPLTILDVDVYQFLLDQGFRRSGSRVYRPQCGTCQRCVPLRIPVASFAPNRSQRRNRSRNLSDVTLADRAAAFDPEHYALYRSYVQSRHADGSMADASPESYRDFLLAPWGGETRFLELRIDERLVAVAATDVLPRGLSAVYTFFDPEIAGRAPGTYSLLCQIDQARRRGLEFLYLGYWIEECRKMSYKDRFRPLEAWIGGRWRHFARGEPIAWRGAAPQRPV
ncbi:MAG: arginyltransferase [Pseudomonadota bacterium]|nr:arginyltransferase [Pseudomonadota bacterium]